MQAITLNKGRLVKELTSNRDAIVKNGEAVAAEYAALLAQLGTIPDFRTEAGRRWAQATLDAINAGHLTVGRYGDLGTSKEAPKDFVVPYLNTDNVPELRYVQSEAESNQSRVDQAVAQINETIGLLALTDAETVEIVPSDGYDLFLAARNVTPSSVSVSRSYFDSATKFMNADKATDQIEPDDESAF